MFYLRIDAKMTLQPPKFAFLRYKTIIFHVAIRLFCYRSQEMLNVEGTSGWALCATLFLLPNFDIIFDLLLNRH